MEEGRDRMIHSCFAKWKGYTMGMNGSPRVSCTVVYDLWTAICSFGLLEACLDCIGTLNIWMDCAEKSDWIRSESRLLYLRGTHKAEGTSLFKSVVQLMSEREQDPHLNTTTFGRGL